MTASMYRFMMMAWERLACLAAVGAHIGHIIPVGVLKFAPEGHVVARFRQLDEAAEAAARVVGHARVGVVCHTVAQLIEHQRLLIESRQRIGRTVDRQQFGETAHIVAEQQSAQQILLRYGIGRVGGAHIFEVVYYVGHIRPLGRLGMIVAERVAQVDSGGVMEFALKHSRLIGMKRHAGEQTYIAPGRVGAVHHNVVAGERREVTRRGAPHHQCLVFPVQRLVDVTRRLIGQRAVLAAERVGVPRECETSKTERHRVVEQPVGELSALREDIVAEETHEPVGMACAEIAACALHHLVVVALAESLLAEHHGALAQIDSAEDAVVAGAAPYQGGNEPYPVVVPAQEGHRLHRAAMQQAVDRGDHKPYAQQTERHKPRRRGAALSAGGRGYESGYRRAHRNRSDVGAARQAADYAVGQIIYRGAQQRKDGDTYGGAREHGREPVVDIGRQAVEMHALLEISLSVAEGRVFGVEIYYIRQPLRAAHIISHSKQ